MEEKRGLGRGRNAYDEGRCIEPGGEKFEEIVDKAR